PTPTPPEPSSGVLEEPVLRRLDPRLESIWRATALLQAAIAVAVIAGAFVSFDTGIGPVIPAVIAAAFGLVYAVLRPRSRYRRWGYLVRASDVVIHRGALWRTVSVVPHVRIQHVDTVQGPLERVVGLASVVIYTAGGVGAMLHIPGLANSDARELRERLAVLSGTDDAV
ncbi:MAG: PH domain-containing protein, partial [Gemmatimonadaceae bacterium]